MADRLGLDGQQRSRRAPLPSGGSTNALARDVHWARQKARLAGLVDAPRRNLWKLSVKGERDLRNVPPGVVVRLFENPLGMALWAEAETALRMVEDGSLQTIVTSPPYPIETAKRYGGLTGANFPDRMVGMCRRFQRVLGEDGSLVQRVARRS